MTKRVVTSSRVMFGLGVLLVACSTTSNPDAPPTQEVPFGAKCVDDSTCGDGNVCKDGGCVAKAATDGVKDNNETDVDCGGGGANPPCADQKECAVPTDCASKICTAGKCIPGGPGDGLQNEDETDVDCGGAVAPKCKDGQGCKVGGDCADGVCGPDGKCAAPSNSDGVQNGTETDVDCGGGGPLCAADKKCNVGPDCDSGFCTANVCEPRKPGRKDGDETDVDCGGKVAPACDWDKACLVDADCTSGGCSTVTKTCLTGPSCKALHGGTTCGTGEFGDAGKKHESCCKSLPVAGYTDPRFPGKKVYLDKYEITAGRMRAFIDAMAAANGGQPNVQGYMAAHRPARWNNGWENTLPQAYEGGTATYTVTNPTGANILYPGQDLYAPTQHLADWSDVSGTYTIYTGINYSIGLAILFPEYTPAYASSHDFNCINNVGSYAFPTYWFDGPTLTAAGANIGVTVGARAYTKDDLDEKALNCTPNGLYAAFCAWDGGQIASTEVWDYVGTPARIGGGSECGAGGNTLIMHSDSGAGACANTYYYPYTGTTADDAARIAPPGRVVADTVKINAADEPWMDMKGNLMEVVLKPDSATFDLRGYGMGYNSIGYHRLQMSTPRGKTAELGARCMRFK
jgi:hypothetical protein